MFQEGAVDGLNGGVGDVELGFADGSWHGRAVDLAEQVGEVISQDVGDAEVEGFGGGVGAGFGDGGFERGRVAVAGVGDAAGEGLGVLKNLGRQSFGDVLAGGVDGGGCADVGAGAHGGNAGGGQHEHAGGGGLGSAGGDEDGDGYRGLEDDADHFASGLCQAAGGVELDDEKGGTGVVGFVDGSVHVAGGVGVDEAVELEGHDGVGLGLGGGGQQEGQEGADENQAADGGEEGPANHRVLPGSGSAI